MANFVIAVFNKLYVLFGFMYLCNNVQLCVCAE